MTKQLNQAAVKAIEEAGGLSALAEKLGFRTNRICNWRWRGIPPEYCARVEKAVGSAVTRKEFRPDDWQDIWPELAKSRTRRRTT